LTHLASATSRQRLRGRIEANQQLRQDLLAERAGLRDRLRAVREVEWYEHAEDTVAADYRGRLDEIVRAVEEYAGACRWLPPLPPAAAAWPPLDGEEAGQLVLLAARYGPHILQSPAQACPDPAGLTGPQDLAELVTRLQAAQEAEAAATGGQARDAVGAGPVAALAQHLADAGADRLGELEALLGSAQQALQGAGLSADPDTWAEGQWTTRALRDGIARQWQTSWDSIRMASVRARQTQEDIAAGSFPDVDIPQLTESQEKELLAASRELEQYARLYGLHARRWSDRAGSCWSSAVSRG
jgi:hypothetical protein